MDQGSDAVQPDEDKIDVERSSTEAPADVAQSSKGGNDPNEEASSKLEQQLQVEGLGEVEQETNSTAEQSENTQEPQQSEIVVETSEESESEESEQKE